MTSAAGSVLRLLTPQPRFTRFLGVRELDQAVAAAGRRGARIQEFGRSRQGHPLVSMTIGHGPRRALWYAGPHANEPVGGNTIAYLAETLQRADHLGALDEWTFHLVPCVDPDALTMNGWLDEPLTPQSYYRHLYRPAEDEWPDWDMPIDYGGLSRASVLPEGRGLRELLDAVQPEFVYALHNGEVGGAFCYLAGAGHVADELSAWLVELGFPPAGTPLEDPTVEQLAAGVFGLPNVHLAYEELLHSGHPDPSSLLRRGASAPHYAHAAGAVALITEVPYWSCETGDTEGQTLSEAVRRAAKQLSEFADELGAVLDRLEPHLVSTGPLRRAVCGAPDFVSRLAGALEHAAGMNELERPATPEELAEGGYIATLSVPQRCRGMLLQLLEGEPASGAVVSVREQVQAEFDDAFAGVRLEPYDLNALVLAQTGAGLLVQSRM